MHGEIQRTVSILVVGGADTGRSPITAALLRRFLAERQLDWRVESAGVVGHDGDPAEIEACNVMLTFDCDIYAHRARSLTNDLVQAATLLLAIDSSVVHVIRACYPEAAPRTITLGALAGRDRDIPDPFRMQIGAWIIYAQEIDAMLRAGLDRLIARLQEEQTTSNGSVELRRSLPQTGAAFEPGAEGVLSNGQLATTLQLDGVMTQRATLAMTQQDAVTPEAGTSTPYAHAAERIAAIERAERLLTLMSEMPEVISWEKAREQLATEMTKASRFLLAPGDMSPSYAALLGALLEMRIAPPTPAQLAALRSSMTRMRTPIDQQAITDFALILSGWMVS